MIAAFWRRPRKVLRWRYVDCARNGSDQPVAATAHPRNIARLARIIAERGRVGAALAAMPGVQKVWPSAANFLLVEFADAAAAVERTRAAGLLLRDFRRTPGLERALRITIGSAEQNDRLLRSLA